MVVGTVQCYDIVLDAEVRSQAAWEITGPATGFEMLEGYFGVRKSDLSLS